MCIRDLPHCLDSPHRPRPQCRGHTHVDTSYSLRLLCMSDRSSTETHTRANSSILQTSYDKIRRYLREEAGSIFNPYPQHSCCCGRFVVYDAWIHREFKDPVFFLRFNSCFTEEYGIIDLQLLSRPRNLWQYFSTRDEDLVLNWNKFSSYMVIQLFKKKVATLNFLFFS
jgi:hypothetical protein